MDFVTNTRLEATSFIQSLFGTKKVPKKYLQLDENLFLIILEKSTSKAPVIIINPEPRQTSFELLFLFQAIAVLLCNGLPLVEIGSSFVMKGRFWLQQMITRISKCFAACNGGSKFAMKGHAWLTQLMTHISKYLTAFNSAKSEELHPKETSNEKLNTPDRVAPTTTQSQDQASVSLIKETPKKDATTTTKMNEIVSSSTQHNTSTQTTALNDIQKKNLAQAWTSLQSNNPQKCLEIIDEIGTSTNLDKELTKMSKYALGNLGDISTAKTLADKITSTDLQAAKTLVQSKIIKNEDLIKKYEECFNDWQFEEAFALLEEMDPMGPKLEIQKAKCLVRMGEKKKALSLLEEELAKERDNVDLQLELGYCLLSMDEVKRGKETLQKTLSLCNSDDEKWLRALAGILYKKETIWQKMLKGTVKPCTWLMLLGNRLAPALSANKKLYRGAKQLALLGRHEEAVNVFTFIIENTHDYRHAKQRRAFSNLASGNLENARQDFQDLVVDNELMATFACIVRDMEKVLPHLCPYSTLDISVGAKDKDIERAFRTKMNQDTLTDVEQERILDAFKFLADYVNKLQYDTMLKTLYRLRR